MSNIRINRYCNINRKKKNKYKNEIIPINRMYGLSGDAYMRVHCTSNFLWRLETTVTLSLKIIKMFLIGDYSSYF